jgi:probable rRNA maturation factor
VQFKTVGFHPSALQGGTTCLVMAPIDIFNRQRYRRVDTEGLARLARKVLDSIGRQEATADVTFIRDRAMRKLNRTYRGIDSPTDVLSFSYDEGAPGTDARHLGDVIISVETAEKYARQLSLEFDRELEHLVIHGILHLAGFDHETDNGEMNRLERRLRRQLLDGS